MSLESALIHLDRDAMRDAVNQNRPSTTAENHRVLAKYALTRSLWFLLRKTPGLLPPGTDMKTAEGTTILFGRGLVRAAENQLATASLLHEFGDSYEDTLHTQLSAINPPTAMIGADRASNRPCWQQSTDEVFSFVARYPAYEQLLYGGYNTIAGTLNLRGALSFVNSGLAIWQIVIEASREHTDT